MNIAGKISQQYWKRVETEGTKLKAGKFGGWMVGGMVGVKYFRAFSFLAALFKP